MSFKTIQSALVSVYDKTGLEPVVRALNQLNITMYSTGGTLKFIQDLGLPVQSVEKYTGSPEILDGRVKTLHPSIFGGILARRDNEKDIAQLQAHGISTIDLVVVDLYPFEDTVRNTSDESEIIEKIDIGGISLIRAAAKNFRDTLIISSREQYKELLQILTEHSGKTDQNLRKVFAARAFNQSSHYDTAIFSYFNREAGIDAFKLDIRDTTGLRYGENPHQTASFHGNLNDVFEVLNGKELSYNNLVDVDASLQLIAEFDEPAFAVIKHTNSCGLAVRSSIAEAYQAAFACDPTSAFGGVLAANREIDAETANAMHSLFFEVISAPSYSEEALQILRQKKNRIILRVKKNIPSSTMFKSLLGGVIEQQTDWSSEIAASFKTVSKAAATPEQLSDLEFAIKAVKHLKSNGIALVKNKQLIGMGCGQTSRVDALESAIKKAGTFGFDTRGAVMASEAFFPFPDCVNISAEAGIAAIAQPGGSIKDQDSIDAADQHGQVMVFTGIRHFRHG